LIEPEEVPSGDLHHASNSTGTTCMMQAEIC